MKKSVLLMALTFLLFPWGSALAQGTIVFNNIPDPLPPNVPSQGFECCAAAEVGDLIELEADTPRLAAAATVLMSTWAKHSDYPDMPPTGYEHPITLNIYTSEENARENLPDESITRTFLIPWRPEPDATCTGPHGPWKAQDNQCYNGYAFTITFDLKELDYSLPEQFVYGIAFNTEHYGDDALEVPGPYDSLNIGIANVDGKAVPPSVGIDADPDVVFINTSQSGFYSDGGAGGVGVLRPDTNWTDYALAVQFTTFAVPGTTGDCKNGAWRNLVRADASIFKNQGDCVSYVNTGK